MFLPEQVKREIPLTFANDRILGACWFQFADGIQTQAWNCLFDTGAQRTLIPQRIWRSFEQEIQWDANSDTMVRGVGGQEIPARDGMVPTTLIASNPSEIGCYSNCNLRFVFDEDAVEAGTITRNLRYLLIGLRGGIVDRGGLCINIKDKRVCLLEL